MVLADKAYSSRAIREQLRRRGVRAVIPQPADQAANRKRRGRRGGRPPAFDREAYKQRNTVERCFNRLKQWRGLATRYEKTATTYLAGLYLVHVGSDSARLPETGNLDYAAAKLSLLALSTSLATEFSPQGIRSNVVIPGPTRTPLYDRPGGFGDQAAELWGTDKESAITRMVTEIRPLLTRRMGQPDDVGRVVAYLVSPLSSQVTAAEWDVDGGALRQV